MNNIPEHYWVSAVPLGGDERIEGNLCVYCDAYDHKKYYCIRDADWHNTEDIEVDPETIEPVRVKPIFDPTEYLPESIYCPNCNYDLMGGIDPDAEHDPPHCWECGQALDWSDGGEMSAE